MQGEAIEDIKNSKNLPLRGRPGGLRQATHNPPAFMCTTLFKNIEHVAAKNSLIIHE